MISSWNVSPTSFLNCTVINHVAGEYSSQLSLDIKRCPVKVQNSQLTTGIIKKETEHLRLIKQTNHMKLFL